MNVIITGASRGIGFELTKLFSENGHSVLAISRNIKSLEELKLSNVIPFKFDLQQDDNNPIITDIFLRGQDRKRDRSMVFC